MATIATSETKTNAPTSLDTVPHWIGGKAVAGDGKAFADVFNPATGEVKRRVPLDGTGALEQAVAAATAAYPDWSNLPPLRPRARALSLPAICSKKHRPARRHHHLRARQGDG